MRCGGHDGADFFLVNAFTKAVASGDRSGLEDHGEILFIIKSYVFKRTIIFLPFERSLIASGIVDSLRSHKLVFAAERSRLDDCIKSVQI